MNFDESILIFRANRMLTLIKQLENDPNGLLLKDVNDRNVLSASKSFYTLMANTRISLMGIILSRLSIGMKTRLILYKKLKSIIPFVLKLKWNLTSRKQ